MSAIGNLVMDIEQVVAPLVYQGASDETIMEQTLKRVPEATPSWVRDTIHRMRFDYGSFDVYR